MLFSSTVSSVSMTVDVAEVQSELQTLHSSHKVETKARISHAACAHFCKAVPHPALNRKLPINNKRWMTNKCSHTLQTHSLLFYDINHASQQGFQGTSILYVPNEPKWFCGTSCPTLYCRLHKLICRRMTIANNLHMLWKTQGWVCIPQPSFSHSLCQVLIERGGGKSSVFCFGGMNAKSHLILWEQPPRATLHWGAYRNFPLTTCS